MRHTLGCARGTPRGINVVFGTWFGLIAAALTASALACCSGHTEPNAARNSVILGATVVDPSRAPVANASMRLLLVNKIADVDITIRGCSGHAISPQTAVTDGRGEAAAQFELVGPLMVPVCAVVIANPPAASGLSADTLVQDLVLAWTGKDSVAVGMQLKQR